MKTQGHVLYTNAVRKFRWIIGLLALGAVWLIACGTPTPPPPITVTLPPPITVTPPPPITIVPSPSTSGPILVRGFVVAAVSPVTGTLAIQLKEIYLPGAEVYLREQGSNNAVTSDVTDLSGRFTFKVRTPGTYQICAQADGFNEGCIDKPLELDNRSAYAGNLRLFPVRESDMATVFGRVFLRDGTRPRMLQLLMGTNAYARVDLEDTAGSLYQAYVNNYGEYVIPVVPIEAPFVLRASIESGQVEQKVDPQTGLTTGSAYQFDLELENTAPKLAPIIPLDTNGKRVEFARPGDTVILTARAEDRDGDTLSYLWLITEGNGTLDATDQPSVKWTLPGTNGRYAVTLLVSDGKGGYADSYFSFSVSTGGVRFSGNVVDLGGASIAGAQIEVNGRSVNANAIGQFQLEVPPTDRYVMNIRKSGYGPASQIYVEGVTGGTWTLRRAERFTVDPSQPITLQQSLTKEDCPGLRARQIPWEQSGYLKPGLIQWQDGTGNALSLAELGRSDPIAVKEVLGLLTHVHPDLAQLGSGVTGISVTQVIYERKCGPGVAVEIPANALVDRDGNPPGGNVEVALSTVDLGSPEQMLGDYSSLDPTANPMVMESYGAGSIEINAGTARYDLKPGTTAKVTIPVDPGQLASGVSLPPTMPLLYYDERRGLWVEEGSLTLVGSGLNQAYVADVKHLSSLNADLQKSGQSCVAVHSGSGLPAAYTIEVTLPPRTPGAAPSVRLFPINNSSSNEHLIYNLPNDVNIVLVPIVAGTKPDGSPGDVPAGVFVVNTGGPQISGVNPPPGPPYYNTDASGTPIGPCLTRVDLANLAIPSAPDAPYEFLQGLDVRATNLTELQLSDPTIAISIANASVAYYNLIDQRGLRQDLIDFKARNLFGQPLNAANDELEVSAVYANSGDLGFGRDMHCRRNRANDGAFDIACYVTNYGDHLTPDSTDAADAANQNAVAEVATVAMEYTRVENPPGDPIEFPDDTRTVKFYVYKKAVPSPTHAGQGNGRATSANLDGAGERPVPQLCVVCHGGNYTSEPADPLDPTGLRKPAFAQRSDVFMNSRFLPFDLHFFTSAPAPNDVNAQQASFRSLNLDFVKNVPDGALASDPVVELINELYPGSPPAAMQNDNAVVPNWDQANPASADHVFYRDVFGRACRTCHITSPFNNVVMNDKTQFRALISTVQTRVCDQHVMPHARRTHDLFWTSLGPNMAAQLQVFGQAIPGWDPTTPNAQCGLSYTPGGNVSVSTFNAKIQPIFTGQCTTCHGTASSFNANLALSAGNAYGNLFNFTSTEHPPTLRVQGGSSSNSYLYRKVEGTHGSLGGSYVSPGPGSQMPDGCTPTGVGANCLNSLDTNGDSTNDLEEIRRWIDVLGAPGP